MVRAYRLEGVRADGTVVPLYETANNYHRRNHVPLSGSYRAIRLIPLSTWGAQDAHVFSFDVR